MLSKLIRKRGVAWIGHTIVTALLFSATVWAYYDAAREGFSQSPDILVSPSAKVVVEIPESALTQGAYKAWNWDLRSGSNWFPVTCKIIGVSCGCIDLRLDGQYVSVGHQFLLAPQSPRTLRLQTHLPASGKKCYSVAIALVTEEEATTLMVRRFKVCAKVIPDDAHDLVTSRANEEPINSPVDL